MKPTLVTRAFFDTNVLLYLLANEDAKADRAEELLAAGGVISVQVLNEFVHVARRKFRAPWDAIHVTLAGIRANTIVEPLTLETHEAGLFLAQRFELSTFDGQLLGAAVLANCDVFYSEDMQDGLKVTAKLTIRNPFLDA